MVPYKNDYNDYAGTNSNIVFMSLKWGGHLGMFANDSWFSKPIFHRFVFEFFENIPK